MSRANKLRASWVVIIGEEEVNKNRYQLKDMGSGEQEEMTREEMMAKIQHPGQIGMKAG